MVALLLQLAMAVGPSTLPCLYTPSGVDDMVTDPHCLVGTDPVYEISPAVLRRLQFEKNGLAQVLVDGEDGFWVYVSRTGRALHAFPFDNGPDYFRQGLTRVYQNGKVGFYNRQLQQVIAPVHDFAFPFDHGRAVVCDGCSRYREGEHYSMAGGVWSCIDLHGRMVLPKKSSKDDNDACGRP